MKRTSSLYLLVGLALAVVAAIAVATHNPAFAAYAAAHPMTAGNSGLTFLGAGMLVNKENLGNLFLSLKTTFNNAFGAAPSVWQKIAMLVPSTTGQNDYAWLSKFPRMRKWIGEKNVKALEGFKYNIVNDDWEATVEVSRNDIEDDNLGIYLPQAQMSGQSAAQLPDEIVMDLANNAFTSLCYDGQYFIDTDHPVKGADGVVASVSNHGVVALSAASQAAAIASVGVGVTAMQLVKDDEGRPLGVNPNIILVGPALRDIARVLYLNDRLDDGKANPYKGMLEPVVDARITSSTAWFLLDTTKPIKPFIYQERKKPVFVSQTDMNADDVFMRKMYKFGAEARAAGGYGFWQLAWASTGAGA